MLRLATCLALVLAATAPALPVPALAENPVVDHQKKWKALRTKKEADRRAKKAETDKAEKKADSGKTDGRK